MTQVELAKKSKEFYTRIRSVETSITRYAKTLIPVLKDAGRNESAKELERLVFEHDVLIEEVGNFFKENIKSISNAMFEGGEGHE